MLYPGTEPGYRSGKSTIDSLGLNRDTGCYGLDGTGFETLQGQYIFLYSKSSEPPVGPTEPPI